MASLTETLDSPSRGEPVIQPAPLAPSVLGSLANLASSFADGLNSNWQQQNQINQHKAANALESGVAKIKGWSDQMAEGDKQAIGLDQLATDQDLSKSGLSLDQLHSDLTDSINNVDKVRKAASQGRVPLEAVDAQMESLVSGLRQKYPDQTAFISQYLTQRGYDHYLNRATNLATASRDADDEEAIKGEAAAVHYAWSKGLVTPGMDHADQVTVGQKAMFADYTIEQGNKTAEQALKLVQIDKERAALIQQQADAYHRNGTEALLDAHFGSFYAGLTHIAGQIQNDDQWEQFIKIQPQLLAEENQYYTQQKQQLQAQNPLIGKEAIDALDAGHAKRIAMINDVFTGDQSYSKQRQQALQNLTTTFGVDASKAAPIYMMMKQFFGPGMLMAFGNDPRNALSPDAIKALSEEMKNFDPTRPESAWGSLALMRQIMNGKVGVNDLRQDQITPTMLQGLNAGAKVNAQEVLGTKATSENHGDFLHSVEALGATAMRIQPNAYKNIDGLDWISGAFANPNVVNALIKEQSNADFSDQAHDSMKITRAAAVNVLETARNFGTNVQFVNGQFVAKPTVNTRMSPAMISAAGVHEATGVLNTGSNQVVADPADQRQAMIMNRALNFLLKTAKFDDQLPKGISAGQLADHYAKGTVLPQAKTEGSKTDDVTTQISKFQKDIATSQSYVEKGGFSQPKNAIAPGEAMSTLQSFGLSKGAAAGITGNLWHESGLDVNSKGDKDDSGQTHAVSIAQWHEDRQALAAKNGYDLHTPQGALAFIRFEGEHGDEGARTAWTKLHDPNITPSQAATIFAQYFERPATDKATGKLSGLDSRIKYAQQFFNEG